MIALLLLLSSACCVSQNGLGEGVKLRHLALFPILIAMIARKIAG